MDKANELIDGCESIAAWLDDAMKPRSAAKIRELIVLARAGSAAPTAAVEPSKQHELTVWYGPMPESNGKSNFTAILMRKHGDKWGNMTDGITIDRSEYPDRVCYEADRVRYLLGELAERPFILDYDADKHSSYAAMSAAPAQPKDTTDTLKGQA